MSPTREAAMRAFELKSQAFDAPPGGAPSAADGGGIDAALRRALRDEELRLDFQPLVAVAGGATTGFEALLRWRRPGYGELAAGRFVSDAEGSPAFDDVGAWALLEAARAAALWPARLRVAVNLSPAQLRSPKLAGTVRSILDQGRLDPRRLELEIVQSALIDDFAAVATTLNALRSYGVTVALDDSALRGCDPRGGANRQGTRVGVDRRRCRDLRPIRTLAFGRLRRDAGLFSQPTAAGKRTRRRVRTQPGRLRRSQRLPSLFALRPIPLRRA
jgi:hypothetical protein